MPNKEYLSDHRCERIQTAAKYKYFFVIWLFRRII